MFFCSYNLTKYDRINCKKYHNQETTEIFFQSSSWSILYYFRGLSQCGLAGLLKKQECNKLDLQKTSGQFKATRVIYLKLKHLKRPPFFKMHQISLNNGYDYQTGKNAGNQIFETTLTSSIRFGV